MTKIRFPFGNETNTVAHLQVASRQEIHPSLRTIEVPQGSQLRWNVRRRLLWDKTHQGHCSRTSEARHIFIATPECHQKAQSGRKPANISTQTSQLHKQRYVNNRASISFISRPKFMSPSIRIRLTRTKSIFAHGPHRSYQVTNIFWKHGNLHLRSRQKQHLLHQMHNIPAR